MSSHRLVVLLTVPVALGALLGLGHGTEAQTYGPYCGYSLADTTPGAASDISMSINIPAPDYNHEDASMVDFSPPDGWTASADDIPIGAGMGTVGYVLTVGLVGGPCNTLLPPLFNLYNASVDISNLLVPDDMYWIWQEMGEYPVPYDNWDPELPDYLEGYPFFLNDLLDPDGDGPAPPLQPRARYAGHDFLTEQNVFLQVVVFSPGQLTEFAGIYAQMGPEYGYPSRIVMNYHPIGEWSDPRPGNVMPWVISDYCTPLMITTTLHGTTTDNSETTGVDESGYTRYLNPPANTGVLGTGTHMARNYSQSERDADGDGFENDLDPCPYNDDTGWQPRAWTWPDPQPGDQDDDGLPDSCDPSPSTYNNDEDGDDYDNGQDNCPLLANGCDTAECSDAFPPNYDPSWDNQADSDAQEPNDDLGPGPDSIGNACDDSDDDGSETGAHVTPGTGNCTDGIDNGDGDGLADVEDPDCTGYEDASDPQAGSCWDGVDNDSTDGADWDDQTCQDTAIFFDNGELEAGTDPWGSWPQQGGYYHAMPWSAICIGAAEDDDDGDGYCDTLETALGSDPNNGSEADYTTGSCDPDPGGTNPSCCDNALDDDGDGYYNDGCPIVGHYAESGGECLDAISSDTPTPDAEENLIGPKVNDGCPVIGVPESLVIDAAINATGGQPSADVPQSCSDGVDNDDNGGTDSDDQPLGCNSGHTSYDGDDDHDGVADTTDNCGMGDTALIWNPEQTNTDVTADPPGDSHGDACDNCPLVENEGQTNTDEDLEDAGASVVGDPLGDECDDDDDNDGFDDDVESTTGTVTLDNCVGSPPGPGADAWPLDNNMDTWVTVGGDVLPYRGLIGAWGGPPSDPNWSQRLDINADNWITVGGDVLLFRGMIGESCT